MAKEDEMKNMVPEAPEGAPETTPEEPEKSAEVVEPEIVNGIEKRQVEHTMEEYFLKYSMSVIIDRALPDVRDLLA